MAKRSFIYIIATSLLTLITSQTMEFDFIKKRREVSSLNTQNVLMFHEEYPLISTPQDLMLANISLGNPPQFFQVLLQTSSFYLSVGDKYSKKVKGFNHTYDYNASSTFLNTTVPMNSIYVMNARGHIATEKMSIGELILDDFNFILLNEAITTGGVDGTLGLGYYYEKAGAFSEKFSLIAQLHKKGLISKKIFSQKFTGENKGIMSIGDMPHEIINDMKNYGTCSIEKYYSGLRNQLWLCNLTGVFFGYDNVNDTLQLKDGAIFETGLDLIIAPSNFLGPLSKIYLKEFIKSHECEYVKLSDFMFFMCKQSSLDKFEDMNFVFDRWVLKMKPNELFKKLDGEVMLFKIVFPADITSKNNIWKIGEPILKKYHMVFDQDSDKIGFYGTNDLFRIDLPFPKGYVGYLVIFYIVGGFVILAFIILGVVLLIKHINRKRYDINPIEAREILNKS